MSKRIPSYRHHKPSGRAVVSLNGRDHYLGPFGSRVSRDEYDRLVGEWLANGRHLPTNDDNDVGLTVVELIAAYLDFAKSYYENDRGTTSEYTSMCEAIRPVRKLYGESIANEFGPLKLKAVREAMISVGWCRTHINRQVNRVRRVFKWGVENELIRPDVVEALRTVAPLKRGRTEARDTEPVRPVPDEHVFAVLPYVSRQVGAMIELQRLSGMRPGEVVLIRPCDVDRTKDVWVYRPSFHKCDYRGTIREVYLGPKAQEVLRPWLVRASESFCFSPAEAEQERNRIRRENRTTPMTPSQSRRSAKSAPKRGKRERFDVASYRRAIKYSVAKSEVPNWSPNQLRHSCATRMRAEFGLDAAQLILGHSNADTTEVYAEADRKRALEVVRKVG